MVEEQAHSYLEAQLPSLPSPHPLKDYQPLTFRTLFGNVTLRSPRFSIEQDHHKTTLSPLKTLFSQRTSPELLYLETNRSAEAMGSFNAICENGGITERSLAN